MKYLEDKNFLNNKQKNEIEKNILNNKYLPFFLSSSFNSNLKNIEYPYFSHIILHRPEDRNHGEYNSNYYPIFLEMLNSFCKKNNIKINEIFRIALNFTFNFGKRKSLVHQDHEFNHKQLIIYLNEADKKAETILLDNKNKITAKITPEKFKGVLFDKCLHYMIYPKFNFRLIAIYTFK